MLSVMASAQGGRAQPGMAQWYCPSRHRQRMQRSGLKSPSGYHLPSYLHIVGVGVGVAVVVGMEEESQILHAKENFSKHSIPFTTECFPDRHENFFSLKFSVNLPFFQLQTEDGCLACES